MGAVRAWKSLISCVRFSIEKVLLLQGQDSQNEESILFGPGGCRRVGE